jgi:hypothetical protein
LGINSHIHIDDIMVLSRFSAEKGVQDLEVQDLEDVSNRFSEGSHRDINTKMQDVQQARNKRMNKKRHPPREYLPGDLVKFRVHHSARNKVSPYWAGPAEVIRRIGPVDYELAYPHKHSSKHPVVHAAYLKPYYPDTGDRSGEGIMHVPATIANNTAPTMLNHSNDAAPNKRKKKQHTKTTRPSPINI